MDGRVLLRALASGACGLLIGAILGATSARAADPQIIPFEEIRPGMTGVGKTVFNGARVEQFEVEILGTMKNILPKKSLILARLGGGPLRDTGILEGMSGSPVYLDGRLAGAVAYSWGFSKEPICGITPIEEMLDMLERPGMPADVYGSGPLSSARGEPAPVSLLAYPDRLLSFLRRQYDRLGHPVLSIPPGATPAPGSLAPMRPTLSFSGYSPAVAREWFPAFEAMSLRPVMATTPADAAGGDISFEPGSAFGMLLVKGDLEVAAIGTVTYVEENRVLGLGHPFFSMGPTAMPLTKAYVYGSIPSLASSVKLAGPAEEIGVVTQDRFAGIAGRTGETVKMVPVRIEMRHPEGRVNSFSFDVVPHSLLTPGLLHVSLLSLLSSEEKQVGDITLRLREGSRIQLSDGLEVKLDNLFSGDLSVLYASGTVAYMTYLLLNNEDRSSRIEGINLLFDYEDERRTARIRKIWLDRHTVAPGETLTLHVDVQPYRSEVVTVELPLKIPSEAPEGKALLQVGDSFTLSRMESVAGSPYFVPRSLEHLVWLLNNIRLNQKIYATVIRPDTGVFISGQRLPNLPPSVSSILVRPGSDPSGSERLSFRALLETSEETPHVVSGYQKALIEIRR